MLFIIERGRKVKRIWDPSSGGMGIKLNIAKTDTATSRTFFMLWIKKDCIKGFPRKGYKQLKGKN